MRIVEKPWGRIDVPVAFGDLAGRRIGEIWFEDPAGDDAPLLVKFLFTSERLSIQVHPDDETAGKAGISRGKAERSEEHTAEVHPHMRYSSDYSCLKNNITQFIINIE